MDKSLHCIFDMNESWVYSGDPELKCNNAEWQSSSHFVWIQLFAVKVLWLMHIIFSHLLSVCARLFHTTSVKSRQLPLLNFAAQDHFEATVPASLSIVLLHLFLGISLLCCPWRFQLKNSSVLAEESFFNIRQTHFHSDSFICTATGFSCTFYVPTLITKQWMVFKFTCTKLSYYNVHMRCYTKCKDKKLSSKHKFPVLYMPDIHFLPLETTSTRKKTLGIQKRDLAAFT